MERKVPAEDIPECICRGCRTPACHPGVGCGCDGDKAVILLPKPDYECREGVAAGGKGLMHGGRTGKTSDRSSKVPALPMCLTWIEECAGFEGAASRGGGSASGCECVLPGSSRYSQPLVYQWRIDHRTNTGQGHAIVLMPMRARPRGADRMASALASRTRPNSHESCGPRWKQISSAVAS